MELGAPTYALEMRKVGVLIEAGFPRFSPNFSREWFAQTLRDAFALSYAGGYQPLKEVLAAKPRTLKLLGIDCNQAQLSYIVKSFNELELQQDALEAFQILTQAGWRLVALTNKERRFYTPTA